MRNVLCASRVLLTCPHKMRPGECGEMNDPGAYEQAVLLHEYLRKQGIGCTLLSGSVDRNVCDLNRTTCEHSFHESFEQLLPAHDVLLDIHSYPWGEAFDQATGVVCLHPRAHHEKLLSRLQTVLPDMKVLPGGDNRLINTAAARGIPALLIELPYRRAGECAWTMETLTLSLFDSLATPSALTCESAPP